MKCRFVKRETFWENLLLASFGIGKKLLQGLPEKLCLGFLLMFTPYEIFLPPQKHPFGREGPVRTPSFPWESGQAAVPGHPSPARRSQLAGGMVPSVCSGCRASV